MTEALRELMAGPYAGKTLLVLRSAFFLLFVVASTLLLIPGRDTLRSGPRGARPVLLAVLALAGFAALAACQARWQLFGAGNADLMRFVRSHNSRPGVDVRRGAILDRNGSILAIDGGGGQGRRYVLGPAAAHVVGYIDQLAGLSGLERSSDEVLSGIAGTPLHELGRLGKSIVASAPVEGRDIHVSLDARLQRFAFNSLEGRSGAVVALDADTGEILALASSPSFDPLSPLSANSDARSPLLNRAIQGKYPPGSTFKIAMSLMAADMGMAPVFDCPAEGFRAKGESRPIRDSEYYSYAREGRKWGGFGKIGLRDALVHSSNVYFAQLALRIPGDSFNRYATLLGLKEPHVLHGAGSRALVAPAGAVPEVTRATEKSMVQLAIGQGRMLVSPLNVALWTAVAANGGYFRPPTLEHPAQPSGGGRGGHRAVSGAAAGTVAAMLRDAVASGTGRPANIPGLGVCGKTGTAQNPHGRDHAWFTCFASNARPRIVVTVLVENGGYGSSGAAPIARKILEEALRLGVIELKGKGGLR